MYPPLPLYSKHDVLPYNNHIHCAAAYNDFLVVADHKNTLNNLRLTWTATDSGYLSPNLSPVSGPKTRSKVRTKCKPLHLAYSPDAEVLVLLDDKIRVLDPQSLELLYKLPNTRYSTSFALDQTDTSRIVVLCKRKFLFYHLKGTPPSHPFQEFAINDHIDSFAFIGDTLYFCSSSSFFMMFTNDPTASPIELFPSPSCLLTPFKSQVFIPTQEIGCFLSASGEATTTPPGPFFNSFPSLPFISFLLHCNHFFSRHLGSWIPTFMSPSNFLSFICSHITRLHVLFFCLTSSRTLLLQSL
ncbi:hypothetical protein GEMRC1_000950 [Eukaryota sp. GEM-RC1]